MKATTCFGVFGAVWALTGDAGVCAFVQPRSLASFSGEWHAVVIPDGEMSSWRSFVALRYVYMS